MREIIEKFIRMKLVRHFAKQKSIIGSGIPIHGFRTFNQLITTGVKPTRTSLACKESGQNEIVRQERFQCLLTKTILKNRRRNGETQCRSKPSKPPGKQITGSKYGNSNCVCEAFLPKSSTVQNLMDLYDHVEYKNPDVLVRHENRQQTASKQKGVRNEPCKQYL